MLTTRKSKVAAVQTAPCFLNVDKTLDKMESIVREARTHGAELVVFPEVFLCGYPYWNYLYTPLEAMPWYARLHESSIDIPGPAIQRLERIARENDVYIQTGVNERGEKSFGTLFNTLVLISPEHGMINRHRKMIPTFAEKLTWTNGDASGLRAVDTRLGRIGMLACGENTNTLARFALLADGEQIHIANFIAHPLATHGNQVEGINIRLKAHSFEGKIFSIVTCTVMTDEMIDLIARSDEERQRMRRPNHAFTGVFGPDGQWVTEPLVDEEGIVYADIDLSRCVGAKQSLDIVGHYNRFDIFELRVNRAPFSTGVVDVTGRGGHS